PSLYHVVWYRPVCPLGTKMLPDGTACRVSAGAACYRQHCLPLRDWLPLMLQMKLWRRWREAFDLIVANSEATKRQLVTYGIEPVEVMWNGVPTRPPRPPLSAPPTVAFAGRLVREKGVDILLHAFAQVVTHLPAARLFIAGDGPERENAQRLMSSLGLTAHVTMLGQVARSEVERQCDAAWVQAVPSRWAEPFGLVAAEAMMRGTAVVVSNAGGLTELVQDGQTGFRVPLGDAAALAAALLKLLQDREWAERMGKTGREVALAHLSEAAYVDRFMQLYETLCRNEVNANNYWYKKS
ncbi:MAG: glycosyltransferase family 4 protein, partial [Candidatus Binatia bacterium]